MTRFSTTSAAAILALAASVPAQDLVFSTLRQEKTLQPLLPALNLVEPQEVMAVTPRSPVPALYTAEKFVPHDAYLTFAGDHDSDTAYWEVDLWKQIDAVLFRQDPVLSPNARDVFFSTAIDVVSNVSGAVIRFGDIVRIRPLGQVETFASELRIKNAFSVPAAIRVNVDAAEYDPNPPALQFPAGGPASMLYLSFEDDHMLTVNCLGTITTQLVPDGSIVGVPVLGFDAMGAILGQGMLVADEFLDIDPMCVASGLADTAGNPVLAISDLDGITLDKTAPAGSLFGTSCGRFPDLWFTGERMAGMGIVSTQGTGTIAVMNGLPLGSPVLSDGKHVGLSFTRGSLNALETDFRIFRFTTETTTPICPGGTICDVEVGGVFPGQPIWVLISTSVVGCPATGVATSGPFPNLAFPELMLPIAGSPIAMPAAAADGTSQLSLPWAGGGTGCLVWQGITITTGGALLLSTPMQITLTP